uniref:Venom protein n=1 Tax=Ampulex compressa TaxID=860918 RepID=A0A1W6EWC9_AMPCP|nr:venom protein [Ampulex compressa]
MIILVARHLSLIPLMHLLAMRLKPPYKIQHQSIILLKATALLVHRSNSIRNRWEISIINRNLNSL